MQYKLIKENNYSYTPIEQILINRGIPYNEIDHYLNTTDDDINDYRSFGEDNLKIAGTLLKAAIDDNCHIYLPIDCDMDGYTSAALFINYLTDIWGKENVDKYLQYMHHEGKQHGLKDIIEDIIINKPDIVICLDAASNDYEEHKRLRELGIVVIVLDHHEAEKISPDAIIINNQLSDYPNKALSGVGVTWQFCRYLDENIFYTNYADKYLDLVAMGLCADMMSLRSFETKHLIKKGLEDTRIKNPFIYYLAKKNSYSLGDHITPIGAAFYIVPFVNAVVRSGTLEEKYIVFNSMLQNHAFDIIPSTKRGCKGQTEKLVEQAVRTAVNVKARQTREQDKAMEVLEKRIEKDNMLNHKVLLFLLEQGEIAPGLAGLVANKIMAKYQRPCCILTKGVDECGNELFQGSARGYSKTGISSFKDICEQSNIIQFAMGHANALGLGILEANVSAFLKYTDNILKDMQSEPLYYVDYIYKNGEINSNDIMSIGSLSDLWGQDIDESYIVVENLKVKKSQINIYNKKDNTIKISTDSGVDIMKFKATAEECQLFTDNEQVTITLVGRCNINEWCGRITPQIFIEEFQVNNKLKYVF